MTVSIFNDVIGPVMRGPSSSHCAAALRLGRLARDLIGGEFVHVLVQFDLSGSLPTTHTGQGSDMGLFGGLMGWDADDDRLPESKSHLAERGIEIEFEYGDFGDQHPNTYRLTLTNGGETRQLIGISTGGGMIEVTEIDGHPLVMDGGFDETLIDFDMPSNLDLEELQEQVRGIVGDAKFKTVVTDQRTMVQIQSAFQIDRSNLADFATEVNGRIAQLSPVLPVRSRNDMVVPFLSCNQMEEYDGDRKTPLWKLAVEFESARGEISEDEVIAKMVAIVRVLKTSLASGLAGTEYEDRVLGFQSGQFGDQMKAGNLLDAGVINTTVLYTTAIMEVKSSMGVIVAAPTAGACAALPATCLAVGESLGRTDEDIAKAMLAAGVIGVFIADAWSFAAEVGGCQAEGGSAAAMAAAAVVTFAGGSQRQATGAASMALQNMLGLICDPVANRVEAPCLGKNVMAASNAICCANMALSGFDTVIPLDETIDAARRVSEKMPREHRCTGLGGLATTPTSLKLLEKMECGQGCCGC